MCIGYVNVSWDSRQYIVEVCATHVISDGFGKFSQFGENCMKIISTDGDGLLRNYSLESKNNARKYRKFYLNIGSVVARYFYFVTFANTGFKHALGALRPRFWTFPICRPSIYAK